ncbi:hypothetical protein ACFQDF_16575 [Ectobacillus funiculus]
MKKVTAGVLSTVVLGMGILAGCTNGNESAASQAKEPEVVTIKAQTAGAEITRVDNLVAASES